MNLTDEQKWALRIAVAEIAGITVEPCVCKAYPWRNASTGEHIPDFIKDLNAVHEVVIKLSLVHECFNGCFWQELRQVVGWPDVIYSSDECHDDFMHSIVNATALQRCIALVMTVEPEKWDAIKAMGGKEGL